LRSSLTKAFEDSCENPASVSQNGQTPFMLAAAKVIIRLTGLNEYAFSSGECPAAPAFQATRHFSWRKSVGIAQVQGLLTKKGFEVFTDTQTSMLFGIPKSAICVQRFDDSLNSAIHITYRISLRSSSMREPRDPLLKVVF
jgi:hypothetical protein